jgi:hypothetical protein
VKNLEDYYYLASKQDTFAALVSARVNDILAGTAHVLDFNQATLSEEQQILQFADLVARLVCANLGREAATS